MSGEQLMRVANEQNAPCCGNQVIRDDRRDPTGDEPAPKIALTAGGKWNARAHGAELSACEQSVGALLGTVGVAYHDFDAPSRN